jgi:nitroreductase
MANEVFEVVRTVMAVREYVDKPIPDDIVRRIVDAARFTASASNIQPWHFVLVREREGLRKLGSLVRTGPYVANAAAAVIVAYEKEKGDFGISDASRAIQSMILTAWEDGVGSNWTGFAGRLDSVRTEFGLAEKYDVLAVVAFGYPKRKVIGKKKRKPFNEVVSEEKSGRRPGS